jgi:formamidopyrimidine-DNA glycosylase
MPELPEIVVIAKQMDKTLRKKEVQSVSITQHKCGNRPVEDYIKYLPGKKLERVSPLGKWIEIVLDRHVRFLISLGMGGEICYFKGAQTPPEKSRLIVRFSDETGFYVTLWWFGYFHLVLDQETHSMTDALGPDPLDISEDEFLSLLIKKRGNIKSFLLNQKRIRGIGKSARFPRRRSAVFIARSGKFWKSRSLWIRAVMNSIFSGRRESTVSTGCPLVIREMSPARFAARKS